MVVGPRSLVASAVGVGAVLIGISSVGVSGGAAGPLVAVSSPLSSPVSAPAMACCPRSIGAP
eukprot:scaffold60173_cov50-Phaeocystis_antarctica.AAC.1